VTRVRRRLHDTWTRIRATKGLGRDLVVIAGLVVLASAVGGFILSHQRVSFPWQEKVTYRADFEEAPGVAPGQGQEVRIAGVPVGEISKADITGDGRARLTLLLKKRYSTVHANARVFLRPKSQLNEMYVLLDPGGKPAKVLGPGSVIPLAQTTRPIQLDEVLSHLDDRARAAGRIALEESDAALARPGSIPPDLQAADATLLALRPVMEALDTRREKIARLVTAFADIATAAGEDDARLARMLDSARETLDTLAARDAELDATLRQLPGFGDDLRTASGAVSDLATQLNPTLDGIKAASDRLPGALAGMSGVVDRLDRTVDLARPVVDGARPLAADLRPLLASARPALADTVAWSYRLDPLTGNLVGHLPDLAAFVYQGNSVFQLDDANGPILRGLVVAGAETITSLLVPHTASGDTPNPGPPGANP
jgi:phospholipid/cholesterol/gamma-HCH transport system substrate-binding protein